MIRFVYHAVIQTTLSQNKMLTFILQTFKLIYLYMYIINPKGYFYDSKQHCSNSIWIKKVVRTVRRTLNLFWYVALSSEVPVYICTQVQQLVFLVSVVSLTTRIEVNISFLKPKPPTWQTIPVSVRVMTVQLRAAAVSQTASKQAELRLSNAFLSGL